MTLTWLSGEFAIVRLGPGAEVPPWAHRGEITSITRTAKELSIVCEDDGVPREVQSDRGWRVLEVAGPMDLGIVGVLASITGPLGAAGLNLFAISTFDTDYILIKRERADQAREALIAAGHEVKQASER